MSKRKLTYHILCGLPGSGKSYYAENIRYSGYDRDTKTDFISVSLDDDLQDDLRMTINYVFNINDRLDRYLYRSHDNLDCAFDGLTMFNTEIFSTFVDALVRNTAEHCDDEYEIDLVLDRWELNRELCLHNDKMRVYNNERTVSSESTIKNVPYEFNESELYGVVMKYDIVKNFTVVDHSIKKVNTYDMVFNPLLGYEVTAQGMCRKSKYMYSDSWNAGGNWCDCWGGNYAITPEAPVDFTQLDNLLENICPDISFLKYKRIKDTCVELDEFSEGDYYGGCAYKARWQCDMEKLYEILQEYGYVKEYNYE